jgi:hypothetical protein
MFDEDRNTMRTSDAMVMRGRWVGGGGAYTRTPVARIGTTNFSRSVTAMRSTA